MYYGKRKLIKKEEFEAYLRRCPKRREELKRGSPVSNRWGHKSVEAGNTMEQTMLTMESRSLEVGMTVETGSTAETGTAVEGGEMNVISQTA